MHLAMERVRSGADVPFGFLEPLLEHALENRRVFQALVGRQSAQQIQWRFRDVVRLLVEADLEALKVPQKARKSVAQFIGGGFVESFMQRLDDAHGDNPAKLAGELRKLALGVVAVAGVRPKKR